MLKVTSLRSDWNPSLAESKTYVCFTTLHCFLIFFCLSPTLMGENTLSKDWLKWGSSFEWLQKCAVMRCSEFSCHVIECMYIFLFSFLFLAFLVYATTWTSKHAFNTLSGVSSIWIFSKMYISTMCKSCILKNPCSVYTMKKKQFFIPLYSSLAFNIIDSKMKDETYFPH